MNTEAFCIGCGCSDYNACRSIVRGACYWLRVDYTEGKGVCSTCSEYVVRWDVGDREPVKSARNPEARR